MKFTNKCVYYLIVFLTLTYNSPLFFYNNIDILLLCILCTVLVAWLKIVLKKLLKLVMHKIP